MEAQPRLSILLVQIAFLLSLLHLSPSQVEKHKNEDRCDTTEHTQGDTQGAEHAVVRLAVSSDRIRGLGRGSGSGRARCWCCWRDAARVTGLQWLLLRTEELVGIDPGILVLVEHGDGHVLTAACNNSNAACCLSDGAVGARG